MKFAIITNVNHVENSGQFFGYAPYVREMNIWFKYVDKVIIVAPLIRANPTDIDIAYVHNQIEFRKVSDFSFTSFKNILFSIVKIPVILWSIFWAMKNADHIHLRCPGNMGLLGCFVQILFPGKIKTAKYAGNWDPKSKQPWTYKLQKRILNNTFLTKNMTVLVYGDWDKQSKNIKSFFTATYSELEKIQPEKPSLDPNIKFIFVGSLVSGKNPMYAVNIVEGLVKKGKSVILNLYGDGVERNVLQQYITNNKLDRIIFLKGNQTKEIVKTAYQESHFVILPSKSEGWPKALAEGMFWGCVPAATKVSCIPYMLDHGKRGLMLEMDLEKDISQINDVLNENNFLALSENAADWSQYYTTEIFELEIKKLLEK
ncbi:MULTISPECIES: glycosyltransferase [unclassified Flavobacterium]|uniref:glycosyltransferase n=1 Tax=unclassified Flavobacterium TaxID=196869 RepID=UPI0006ABD88B|nr:MULTISPECIES: glycosyltransferase [unclassified Flavobacterium]KOP39523.1 glycosyl transferase [Flavobacterium sp. VMW]OWU91813.1 glycosyl transferase [Flavobacterium sp. NLM]